MKKPKNQRLNILNVKKEWLLAGYISKAHGAGGKIVIRLRFELIQDIDLEEPLFIEINETLVPFFIQEVEIFTEKLILKLEFIETLEDTKQYIGSKVYFNLEGKNVLEDDISSFIGFTITDKESNLSGLITNITKTHLNPLFEVRSEEKEFYIPAQSDLVVNIDYREKHIIVKLPKGFTDI